MKITITSTDIEKMSQMDAEERVIYLEEKMTQRKNEQLSWMSAGFDAAFGVA